MRARVRVSIWLNPDDPLLQILEASGLPRREWGFFLRYFIARRRQELREELAVLAGKAAEGRAEGTPPAPRVPARPAWAEAGAEDA